MKKPAKMAPVRMTTGRGPIDKPPPKPTKPKKGY